jgi:gliding motility-associated-like protein
VPTGEIDLIIPNPNATISWEGPVLWNGNIPVFPNSTPITSLFEGDYILTISEYGALGDTICQMKDTFTVNQTNDIEITEFYLEDICSSEDSADLIFTVTGGTPYNTGELYDYELNFTPPSSPGSSLTVGTNDTILDLPPGLYTLIISDKNGCEPRHLQEIQIDSVSEINPFMSSVGVICKDDNTGQARVFVDEGTPPFIFNWGTEIYTIEHDSFSVITDLFPGIYSVEITDAVGCVIIDSIEVKSNPKNCIVIYKAFSPNGDDINQFWQIEGIDLYPSALVSIYDRNGSEVFRRRNYKNAENIAFGGVDGNGQPLPSGQYYYIIDLENGDDIFKGVVMIVR